METFATIVNAQINRKDSSLRKIEGATGISRSTLSRIFSGTRGPEYGEVLKIAGALRLDPNELLQSAGYKPLADIVIDNEMGYLIYLLAQVTDEIRGDLVDILVTQAEFVLNVNRGQSNQDVDEEVLLEREVRMLKRSNPDKYYAYLKAVLSDTQQSPLPAPSDGGSKPVDYGTQGD